MMIVPVTNEHIDCGRRGDALDCALVQAVEDALGTSAMVISGSVWVDDVAYAMSDALKEWVSRFDNDYVVSPIVVSLSNEGANIVC